jgi:hypothetical protein
MNLVQILDFKRNKVVHLDYTRVHYLYSHAVLSGLVVSMLVIEPKVRGFKPRHFLHP